MTSAIETGDGHGGHQDVVVGGGGQAGLAIGYFLAQKGRDFTILEAAEEPATERPGFGDRAVLSAAVPGGD